MWYGLPVNVTPAPNYDGAETAPTCVVGSNYNYILKEGGGFPKFSTIEDPSAPVLIF